MRVLDLFCGGGGASMGIHWAGHKVEGVDIVHQPDYPFKLHVEDAITFAEREGWTYDAIWASPPCQAYTKASQQWRNQGKEYPDLIEKTREVLLSIDKPFVMENVVEAPLRKDLILCMSMFDEGRKYTVRRHRAFEIHGFTVPQPEHKPHVGKVGDGRVISVFGHGGGKRYNHCTSEIAVWREAMGCPWIIKRETLTEAIPPWYAQYIFSFLREE